MSITQLVKRLFGEKKETVEIMRELPELVPDELPPVSYADDGSPVITSELMQRYHSDETFREFWKARNRENYWRKAARQRDDKIRKLRKELRQLKKQIGSH